MKIRTRYELVSVTQVSGLYSVHAMECDETQVSDENSPLMLKIFPVELLGVAKVKELHYRDGENKPYKTESAGTDLVPVIFMDGYMDILPGSDDYVGICKEGDDFTQVRGYLRSSLEERLIEQPPTYASMKIASRWGRQ